MTGPGAEHAAAIIQQVLAAADPARLVLQNRRLPALRPTAVLAVGKAAAAMASSALSRVQPPPPALVIGPDAPAPPRDLPHRSRFIAAGHPTPDARSLAASEHALAFVQSLARNDTLLFLLSGGASALLCSPRPPLRVTDLASMTEALLRAGAPIEEVNTVRKHCEVLKGGGLAAASGAGRIVSLILSDVLGDPLDAIGSGPTAPDSTTFADALDVLGRRALLDVSPAVTSLLRRGADGREPETVKPGDPLWSRVENVVIGNNLLALDAACQAAAGLGYAVAERRERVEGEAADVGRALARAALELRAAGGAPACIAWGGETTVTVGEAPGLGGRNQELALAAATELEGDRSVTLMSLATDGRDGPTDAAGGIVSGETCPRIRAAGIEPGEALLAHSSHAALAAADALVRTGATGTNVNDLMIALVR